MLYTNWYCSIFIIIYPKSFQPDFLFQSYLTVARMRKLLDQTIFKVALPQGVKRLVADNYIQTVWNAKVILVLEERADGNSIPLHLLLTLGFEVR